MKTFTIDKLVYLPEDELYEIKITQAGGWWGRNLILEKDDIKRLHAAIHEFLGEQEPTKKMRPLHPGEVLLEEFIKPVFGGITYFISRTPVGATEYREYFMRIICRAAKITPMYARLLSQSLDTTPEFWLNLQADYDREMKEE